MPRVQFDKLEPKETPWYAEGPAKKPVRKVVDHPALCTEYRRLVELGARAGGSVNVSGTDYESLRSVAADLGVDERKLDRDISAFAALVAAENAVAAAKADLAKHRARAEIDAGFALAESEFAAGLANLQQELQRKMRALVGERAARTAAEKMVERTTAFCCHSASPGNIDPPLPKQRVNVAEIPNL